MKESDWKIFKQIKQKAFETFCRQALDEFEEVINDSTEHVHDRYLQLYELIQNRDKQMQLLFDDHSRSKAPMQLLMLRSHGLVDEELLGKLSEELHETTDPDRHKW